MRDLGCTVFSPYSIEIAKALIRAIAVSSLGSGAKFLMLQDSPGEGMQANIFKRFYWGEDQHPYHGEGFRLQIIYRSWKQVCDDAKMISDEEAEKVSADWNINSEGVRGNFCELSRSILPSKR